MSRVYEYDGAFKCLDCGNMWGAVTNPTECSCPPPMTTPTETPTPRTDAVAFDVNISTALDCSLYAECVRADEMRTLERQLTAATAQLEEARRDKAAIGEALRGTLYALKEVTFTPHNPGRWIQLVGDKHFAGSQALAAMQQKEGK